MDPAKIFACAMFILFTGGCTHFPLSADYKGPKLLPQKIIDEYSYKKFKGIYEETTIKREKRYTVRQIKFPSCNNILDGHDMYLEYYDARAKKKIPVIIILPILGGEPAIERFFASYFANNGYAAVLVHRQEQYKEIRNINKIDTVLRQVIFDHKQVIDWIETRQELDADKIGVFGISIGAINGALLASLDNRVKAGVLAMGGGDIPYILCHSKEEGIIKAKNEILLKENWTTEEFHRQLEKKIKCDPINYAEYLDARNILMILAIFDQTVPYAKGEELRKKIGEPETIYLFAGHYTAILYILYARYASLQFLQKKLGKP